MKLFDTSADGFTVTVIDPQGHPIPIPLEFTPKRRRLTRQTAQLLLSTGFQHGIFGTWRPDAEMIGALMRRIRDEALTAIGGRNNDR